MLLIIYLFLFWGGGVTINSNRDFVSVSVTHLVDLHYILDIKLVTVSLTVRIIVLTTC